ncbi:MAG: hypothetical protein ACOY46_09910 [Bacillota bacterium]
MSQLKDSQKSLVELLVRDKNRLIKIKKDLQVKGYEEFIETGNVDLYRKVKKINDQILQIDNEISFLESNLENIRLQGSKNSDYKKLAENDLLFSRIDKGKR